MENHLKLVGILNIVYRSLALIGGVILGTMAVWFTEFYGILVESSAIQPHEVPYELVNIIPLILTPIALLIVLVSTAGIIGGIGVLDRKEWGRIVLMIVSFFNLLRIPLGTILGVYSIWVLMNKETIGLFNPNEVKSGKEPGI